MMEEEGVKLVARTGREGDCIDNYERGRGMGDGEWGEWEWGVRNGHQCRHGVDSMLFGACSPGSRLSLFYPL